MSSLYKNIIIAGAAGNLGATVLDEFLTSSDFNVTVLTRKKSSSTFAGDPKVIKADYTSVDDLTKAFEGQDAVLSLIGYASAEHQKAMIDACIKAGVKRFFPSEYGHPLDNRNVDFLPPVFPVKDEIIEYLRTKESDGMSWTAVITGGFFDMVCCFWSDSDPIIGS